MMPILRQRALLLIAITIGSTALFTVIPAVTAADGSEGLTLESASSGAIGGALQLMAAALPAVILACVVASTTSTMSGLLVVTASLLIIAWAGGSTHGWLFRSDVPGSYLTLMIELTVWTAVMVAITFLIGKAGNRLHDRVPPWARRASNDHVEPSLQFNLESLAACGATAVVAGTFIYFLVSNDDIGQILLGVMFAFMVGAFGTRFGFQQTNPLAVLLSPLIVGIVGYTWVMLAFDDYEQVIAALGNSLVADNRFGRVPGLALVLPMHYIAAGMTGCVLGMGWAKSVVGEQPPEIVTATND